MAVSDSQIKYFINLLGTLAVSECNRRIAAGMGFVLPSVCIAQSAHETGWGTAGIMVKANAFFGIKAGGSWTGKVYRADTWEVADGVAYNTVANFRAYDSLEDSVADYYNLIVNNSRYAKGICYGADPSQWLTAREALTAIWAGGYATDDEYVPHVMNLLNGRDLTYYDTLISGAPPVSYSLSKTDFTQGAYVSADSGRSLSLDITNTIPISLKVDKQIVLEGPKTLTFSSTLFSVIDEFRTKLIYVANDTYTEAWLDEINYTITLPANSVIALSIYRPLDGNEYSQLPYDAAPGFTIEVKEGYENLPDHAETVVNGIAFFVKVE